LIVRWLPDIVEYSRQSLLRDGAGISVSERAFYKRTLILKSPVYQGTYCVEKGVMVVTFTETFGHLYRHADLDSLLEAFYLVLEPSWAGYALPEILAWAHFPHPILVQASERRDRALLEQLNTNLEPIDIGASNWVDHRLFRPLPGHPKVYDAILVGNGTLSKRIHVFLRAVAAMRSPRFQCALVLPGWGRYGAKILALIQYYGLTDCVTVFRGLSQEKLNELFNQSKINVVLSLKEGSNRVAFEGFFAGVPAVILRDNIGINKEYFTAMTGIIVEEHELRETLELMRDHWLEFQPREWAMKHISFNRSTERLTQWLKTTAARQGLRFQRPVSAKVNAPEVKYIDDPYERVRQAMWHYVTTQFMDMPK